jgi:hypothetical protein
MRCYRNRYRQEQPHCGSESNTHTHTHTLTRTQGQQYTPEVVGARADAVSITADAAWRITSLIFVDISGKEHSSADSSVSHTAVCGAVTPAEGPGTWTRGIPGVKIVSIRGAFVLMLFSAASTAAIADARTSKEPGPPDSRPIIYRNFLLFFDTYI